MESIEDSDFQDGQKIAWLFMGRKGVRVRREAILLFMKYNHIKNDYAVT